VIHKCYKVTGPNGEPCHGGSGRWIPGEWREETVTEPCQPGMMHVCKDAQQLLEWLNAEVWEAEYDDAKLVIDHGDKLAVQRTRVIRKLDTWSDRTARLFACDCAEMVLPLFEKDYPNDTRPRKAIETARLFADGKASRNELNAARDAAWDAARAAARAAAGGAARAAAGAAAWAAAGAAAGAAARDAEKKWQTQRLIAYLENKVDVERIIQDALAETP
jgi:hypothetical protein